MKRSASISECGLYRYTLWRFWGESQSFVAFIELNPSTADANSGDPTIRRCISFAKSWGGGLMDCAHGTTYDGDYVGRYEAQCSTCGGKGYLDDR